MYFCSAGSTFWRNLSVAKTIPYVIPVAAIGYGHLFPPRLGHNRTQVISLQYYLNIVAVRQAVCAGG
jgi:hypothetical protein